MTYTSFLDDVLSVLAECKHEFCEGVGTLVTAEVQSITPVDKSKHPPHAGNLKRSITYDVLPNDEGVSVGSLKGIADYGIWVEKGSTKQKAQPYLEPGTINAIPKIIYVAQNLYTTKLGGE